MIRDIPGRDNSKFIHVSAGKIPGKLEILAIMFFTSQTFYLKNKTWFDWG